MDNKKKEYLSHKYFKDMKIKNLKDFTATTPKGNIIEGIICKKANHFLGSMVIDKIIINKSIEKNGDFTESEVFETEQFIQAMPKIHYYDYHHEMYVKGQTIYPAYEKLDGSCLILFGLYKNKELIEIIPKTRGVPVADPHIIEMFNEIDQSNIEEFFKQNKDLNPTLLFELFGTLNQHSIFYPKVRIDINLIGGTIEGRLLDSFELDYLSSQFDFDRPKKLFNIVFYNGTWKIRVQPGIFHHYLFLECEEEDKENLLKMEYPTQLDVIQAIKEMITTINKNFSNNNNRQLLEGVVVNTYNSEGNHFMYLKIKSADIEEKCRTENGIPRKIILKEVHKYFDEYGSNAKQIYLENENHYRDYINKNLLEEFTLEAVNMKRTQSRITNVFLDVLEAKEPPKGLQQICNDLVEKYPGSEISDLMRLFAQEYPEKKRQARIAYSIFEKII